nr:methyl-accepting chemotaxis protein [uncultured Methanospirillum sp.]
MDYNRDSGTMPGKGSLLSNEIIQFHDQVKAGSITSVSAIPHFSDLDPDQDTALHALLSELIERTVSLEHQVAESGSILDAVPYPIHVTDNDMKWTYMNKAFETLLIENKVIKTRESAYGMPCRTANANICGTDECGIHQLQTSGKNETYFDWLGASCKQTTAPVLDADGNKVGYVEVVHDLTEQMNQIAYYQSILDAVPYPIHVTDTDMKWTYLNKAFEKLLIENKVIKNRESAYGMPCRTANANICGTDECGIHQLRTSGKDETYFDWLGASCKQTTAPVLDAKGGTVGYVEVVHDLTEQMNQIAYYQSILDAVPYPIHVTDNDMKWTYLNKAFEKLLIENKVIKNRETAYGMPCRTANANICGTNECGINQLLTTGKNETYFDWLGASCKQTTAPVLDAKGSRVGFVETVQDLTEQMNQIAYYQSILDAVPYPIHVTDNDMKWKYMNKAFEKLLIDNKEIKDRDSAYGLPCRTANANICGTGDCGIHKLRTTGKNETYFDWHGASCKQTTAPVLDARGDAVGYVETVQDLSEQVSLISFMKTEVERVTKNLQLLSTGDLNLNLEITKADSYTTEAHDAFVTINENLQKLTKTLEMLVSDVETLSEAAVAGNLEIRADTAKHLGKFRTIVEGVNSTLDSVIVPVKEALRVSKEYSQYNFKARVDPGLKVEGDWIEFKDALNDIGSQIAGAVGLINNQLLDLASNAEEATASIEEVSAGAQQIAHNAGSVSSNAAEGEDGIVQVLKAMEDLNITVGEVSRRAEQVSTTATLANDYSKKGVELAEQSEGAMQEIRRSSEEVAQIVTDINRQMDEIGKIVRLISDIANQTNLLALNAAIEAARAGEAGRGFAVVAAEVKSLAQDSRQSAENIADMIATLQDKARKANDAMGKAGSAVEQGSASLAQTLGSFNQIAVSIDEITTNATDVASASEEQAASVEEVTASIHEVSGLIQNTTKDAGDAAAATEEASASIEQISKIVSNVSGIADSVSREMSKFKV